MRCAQFGDQHPDMLGSRRDVDPQQLLNCLRVCHIVRHRGQIVKPVGIRDKLVKRFHLSDFLLAAVQIAEVGCISLPSLHRAQATAAIPHACWDAGAPC